MRQGHRELGISASNQCLLFDQLLDSDPLFLTGNTDTVYASVILDLGRDGPTVGGGPAGLRSGPRLRWAIPPSGLMTAQTSPLPLGL